MGVSITYGQSLRPSSCDAEGGYVNNCSPTDYSSDMLCINHDGDVALWKLLRLAVLAAIKHDLCSPGIHLLLSEAVATFLYEIPTMKFSEVHRHALYAR